MSRGSCSASVRSSARRASRAAVAIAFTLRASTLDVAVARGARHAGRARHVPSESRGVRLAALILPLAFTTLAVPGAFAATAQKKPATAKARTAALTAARKSDAGPKNGRKKRK